MTPDTINYVEYDYNADGSVATMRFGVYGSGDTVQGPDYKYDALERQLIHRISQMIRGQVGLDHRSFDV